MNNNEALPVGLVGAAALVVTGMVAERIGNHYVWYPRFKKPAWAPPARAIGPMSTVGHLAVGLAAWRLLRHPPSPARSKSLSWLGGEGLAVATWQGLFLGAHCRRAGFMAALGRVVLGGMAVRAAWSVDRTASAALVIPTVSSLAFVALQAANLALDPPAPRRGG